MVTVPPGGIAWTEADRLAALRAYDILDAPAEGIFQDFIEIAAEICGTPMALVSFVDEHRQWFAAELGVGVRETPIGQSVCAHAIYHGGVFSVPDLASDPRFEANPLVTGGPKLRFYGGALLQTADGLPLGAICVLDDKPRPHGLSEKQERALTSLARQVMAQLELRRAMQQRAEAWAAQDLLLRQAEALLAEKNAALEEKDLLMQEAHHRVKNSLSTVQALLTLQARNTMHPEAAQQLRQSADRIRTFSAMHEHLYRVGATADVDLSAYLGSLLQDQQPAPAGGRAVQFQATPLPWASADAPTLGLIMIELVTNAMKYGAGTIGVTLVPTEAGASLTVADEGQALADDFDPAASKGFGMRIVRGLLSNQKRGRLEVDRTRGHTCFVVTLNALPPARG